MDPFIGQIVMFAGNFAPRGWALCEGQLLPIAQNQALFSILGTTYGGDGRTTFALPDLRGRAPIQQGSGPGLPTYSLGQKGGNATTTLTTQNLPAHSHSLAAKEEANSDVPNGNFVAGAGFDAFGLTSDTTMSSSAIGNTGANIPFSNQPPYLAINYIIALVGTFPSRN